MYKETCKLACNVNLAEHGIPCNAHVLFCHGNEKEHFFQIDHKKIRMYGKIKCVYKQLNWYTSM